MTTWVTLIAFLAVTLLLAVRHARRGAGADDGGSRCPRCRARLADGAASCAACHAPPQAFELVLAPVVRGDAGAGPRHARVRADVCVGCGTCVAACPEPGAIALVGKIARVDRNACKGHGQCAAACPVGAIVVGTGAAVQEVEVPDLTVDFESNVPGLYIVGELGGRGLIKNAVNEGKLAVEHAARTLANPATGGDAWDVVIAGGGPAGLSAALEARARGLRYVVLEQGTLMDTVRRYPREKLLFAEPARIPLYGDLWVADASKETLLRVWQNVIDDARLAIRTQERVEAIECLGRHEPDGARFVVRGPSGTYRARRLVLAMGRRGTPRTLGVPGEQLDKVFYDIVEMEAFAGKRMLVVGGGDSAVESALGLAHQPRTPVTLAYRGDAFARVKERNRAKLEAAAARGAVALSLRTEVREILRDAVTLEVGGEVRTLPNDVVIVRIGGEAAYPMLQRLGVRIVRKAVPIADDEAEGRAVAAGA